MPEFGDPAAVEDLGDERFYADAPTVGQV